MLIFLLILVVKWLFSFQIAKKKNYFRTKNKYGCVLELRSTF